ncbi:MAG TPA: DUF4236 domain-containing protein [Candidatus Binataceae bacterium]|jgi:uncharacterized protein DUF4236|nr:DUF4236 domain-containing protein [Candidatus Binataceae bacterium]
MGNFRFYRRLRIFPGLSVNLSKSGPSLTVGMRGAHLTMGPKGVRRTVGIPGTGIYYTSQSGYHSGVHSAHVETEMSPEQQQRAHGIGGLLALALIVGIAVIIGIAIGSANH